MVLGWSIWYHVLISLPSTPSSLPPSSSSHSQVVSPPLYITLHLLAPLPLSSHAVFSLCLPLFLPIPQPLCVLCISKKKKGRSQINLNPKKVIDGCAMLPLSISFHLFPFFPVFIPTLPSLPLLSPTGTVAHSHSHTHTYTQKLTHAVWFD